MKDETAGVAIKEFVISIYYQYCNFLPNYKNIVLTFSLVRTVLFSSYKNFVLSFSLIKAVLFLIFSFSNYRMIDSEYSTDNYKSLKISIGATTKNPEMLRLIPDHSKMKKMCNHAVKKLSFITRYSPDQYGTQQMCDGAILENGETLESIPN